MTGAVVQLNQWPSDVGGLVVVRDYDFLQEPFEKGGQRVTAKAGAWYGYLEAVLDWIRASTPRRTALHAAHTLA